MNNQLFKIILAFILLICLFKMPYGYYEFVRISAMIGFAYLAYSYSKNKNENVVFIYVALTILFQPFVKFAFGRTIWNIIDVIVAIGLLISLMQKSDKK
jgi:hypothetical protein